jgi:ferredoxin--NADP+ reductase
VLAEWAQRPQQGRPRRIHFRFMLRPIALVGTTQVESVVMERTRFDDSGQLESADREETLDAQMVIRSAGYRGVPIPGLPFDSSTGTIPNDAGRMLRDGAPSPGEYVAGWVKRGPTGVIGTNRSDAAETVRSIAADWEAKPLHLHADDGDPVDALVAAGVHVVRWDGWLGIEAAEQALGAEHGQARIKLTDREALLAAAATRS